MFTIDSIYPPKKSPSEARARRRGGCGGNSASPEPKRSPAVLLSKSRESQKSFLYLLEEKRNCARKSKNKKKTFLRNGERKRAAAGLSVSFVQKRFGFRQTNAPRVNPCVGLRVLKVLSPFHPLQGCRFSSRMLAPSLHRSAKPLVQDRALLIREEDSESVPLSPRASSAAWGPVNILLEACRSG